jgi:hypothetical protein
VRIRGARHQACAFQVASPAQRTFGESGGHNRSRTNVRKFISTPGLGLDDSISRRRAFTSSWEIGGAVKAPSWVQAASLCSAAFGRERTSWAACFYGENSTREFPRKYARQFTNL